MFTLECQDKSDAALNALQQPAANPAGWFGKKIAIQRNDLGDTTGSTAPVGSTSRAMISRHWMGTTKRGFADRYIEHLKTDTLPGLAAIPGFVSISILRREVTDGTEFQIVTVWTSFDSIREFAGADPEAAVVPPAAQAMMTRFDRRVVHYEVVNALEPRVGSKRSSEPVDEETPESR